MIQDRFDQIFIDQRALGSELAERAFLLFPKEKIEICQAPPLAHSRGPLSPEEFALSKRRLWITPFKGQFFKRCPGSRPGLMCCNYYVLNWGVQCDMNCSYCYLQSFVNSPVMTLYSNIEEALKELVQIGSQSKDQKIRIGTGETVDSLSMDEFTLHSRKLIEFFQDYPNWTLEFKTKSAQVDQFLKTDHSGNVVVSWSMNPQNIIEAEEHLTASLSQRLLAAKKCLKAGFQVAFHLDPMIHHENWKASYAQLVREITHQFSPSEVNVISVGALRFQPEQRHMMKERFGMKSLVNQAEMFKSRDGKLRYDSELRSEMFRFLLDQFRQRSLDWKIFLCMETPETWLGVDKKNPYKDESIKDLFTKSFSLKKPAAERPQGSQ